MGAVLQPRAQVQPGRRRRARGGILLFPSGIMGLAKTRLCPLPTSAGAACGGRSPQPRRRAAGSLPRGARLLGSCPPGWRPLPRALFWGGLRGRAGTTTVPPMLGARLPGTPWRHCGTAEAWGQPSLWRGATLGGPPVGCAAADPALRGELSCSNGHGALRPASTTCSPRHPISGSTSRSSVLVPSTSAGGY